MTKQPRKLQRPSGHHLKPDVYVARMEPCYDVLPLAENARILQTLGSIWEAMGFDRADPFRHYLTEGDCAVIKPNWVMDVNPAGHGLDCLVTHATLILCMMDWCGKALRGHGTVVVGDCPIQGCDFEALQTRTGFCEAISAVRQKYPALRVEIADWRLTLLRRGKPGTAKPVFGSQTVRDSEVAVADLYTELDAGHESFLEDIADYSDRFRVTMYKPSWLQSHHRPGVHRYLVRNEVLDADLLINLPKMKTHEKAGLTGAMKNLVGVNGHKEYLPHHIKGSYFTGGDSYCSQNRFAALAENLYDWRWENHDRLRDWHRWAADHADGALRLASRLTGGDRMAPGGWSGNETVWRMTLDLNHLVYFNARRSKHILNVIDGVVAGEGNGPLRPAPKPSGLVLVGENPAYVDAALARLMGYNVARVPTVYQAVYHRRSRFGGPFLEDAPVHFVGSGGARTAAWPDLESLNFKPPRYWRRALAAR